MDLVKNSCGILAQLADVLGKEAGADMVEKKAFGPCFTRHFCRLHVSRVSVLPSNLLIALAIGGLVNEDIGIDRESDTGIGLTCVA